MGAGALPAGRKSSLDFGFSEVFPENYDHDMRPPQREHSPRRFAHYEDLHRLQHHPYGSAPCSDQAALDCTDSFEAFQLYSDMKLINVLEHRTNTRKHEKQEMRAEHNLSEFELLSRRASFSCTGRCARPLPQPDKQDLVQVELFCTEKQAHK